MALFGSTSKSRTTNTSQQQGIEGEGNVIASEQASVVFEFPEAVADFAKDAFGLARQAVTASTGLANQAGESLNTLATREKSPEQGLLPFVLVGAIAVAAIAIFGR